MARRNQSLAVAAPEVDTDDGTDRRVCPAFADHDVPVYVDEVIEIRSQIGYPDEGSAVAKFVIVPKELRLKLDPETTSDTDIHDHYARAVDRPCVIKLDAVRRKDGRVPKGWTRTIPVEPIAADAADDEEPEEAPRDGRPEIGVRK